LDRDLKEIKDLIESAKGKGSSLGKGISLKDSFQRVIAEAEMSKKKHKSIRYKKKLLCTQRFRENSNLCKG
jgi:hypothetical protein